MSAKNGNGILIVFDGVDGAGKTTQVNMLASLLKDAGEEVITSKEPTDGLWGQKIRNTLLSSRMSFEEELEAFINDREEHIETKIKPALAAGKIVILDRYFYSTIAYQGIRTGAFEELDNKIRSNALVPHLSFILDIDPEIAALRIRKRDGKPNTFEGLEDQIKIREIFKRICLGDSSLIELNSNRDIDQIHADVIRNFIDIPLKSRDCFKQYGCDDEVMCGYRMTNMCEWWKYKNLLLKKLANK